MGVTLYRALMGHCVLYIVLCGIYCANMYVLRIIYVVCTVYYILHNDISYNVVTE